MMTRPSCASPLVSLLVVAAMANACSVPKSMHVRSGEDPYHRDEEVRFRTTYYFRAFDSCEGIGEMETRNSRADSVLGGKAKGPYHPRTDSLYRFRMTGKGNSLFQRIHFESGTLRKEEIDPFGSIVAYDSRTGRFVYRSREETQSEARREARVADIDKLRGLRGQLDPRTDEALLREVNDAIRLHIKGLAPTDVLRRGDAAGEAGAVPTAVAGLTALRDRASGLLAEVSVLDGIVATTGRALGSAEAAAVDRLRSSSGAAKRDYDALQKLWPKLVAGRPQWSDDVPSAAGREAAMDAVARLGTSLGDTEFAAVPLQVDAATSDEPTKKALADLAGNLETWRTSFAARLGAAENAVDALSRYEKAVRDAGGTGDKVALLRQQAKGLLEALAPLDRRVGLVKAAVDGAREEHRALAALAGAQKAVTGLALLTGDTNLRQHAAAARDALATATKDGHTAADKALDAAKKLQDKDTASLESVRAYGEAARTLANSASAAKGATDTAAATAQEGASRVATRLDDVVRDAPASRGSAPARSALEHLSTRLTEHHAAWDALKADVTRQAAATTQIAATMTVAPGASKAGAARSAAGGSDLVVCPSGTLARRGFQILGPEGWRTFDQDERLIMAMSSSAKPLVNTLQELSRNVLNAQQNPAEALLPLVLERLRIVEALQKAGRYAQQPEASPDDVVADVIAAFNREVGGPGAAPGEGPR
jgi:hypothetical protein